MRVDGKCFCGAVTYEAEIDEEQVLICQCADCQSHSGSAYRVIVGAVNNSFKLLSGELRAYEKVADSGNVRSRPFCTQCGTNIYACTADDPGGFFGLRVGTITQRDQLVPKMRIWSNSAQPWSADLSAMASFPQQPDT